MVFIFFIARPYYLYKRNKLEPDECDPVNRLICLVTVIVLVGGITILNYLETSIKQSVLPACDAPEVVEVLGKLLNGMAVSNPAQRPESEDDGDVRLCNSIVAGRIQQYRLTWYSNDKVQLIVNLE